MTMLEIAMSIVLVCGTMAYIAFTNDYTIGQTGGIQEIPLWTK